MFQIKTSVNDAMKIMRDRADAQKTYSDNLIAHQKRVRIQNITTVAGYVAGVVIGAGAVVWSFQQASKPMDFEDEN